MLAVSSNATWYNCSFVSGWVPRGATPSRGLRWMVVVWRGVCCCCWLPTSPWPACCCASPWPCWCWWRRKDGSWPWPCCCCMSSWGRLDRSDDGSELGGRLSNTTQRTTALIVVHRHSLAANNTMKSRRSKRIPELARVERDAGANEARSWGLALFTGSLVRPPFPAVDRSVWFCNSQHNRDFVKVKNWSVILL